MAVGDLTPDQSKFIDFVASDTGIDKNVVTAWLGAESHWGVTKAGHNYLNIGPGETYNSVDMAAARTAGLINSSSYYKGIKAATAISPLAQISAIKASPWDAGHYSGGALDKIYSQLAVGTAAPRVITDPMSPVATPTASSANPLDPSQLLTNPWGALGGGIGGLAGALFKNTLGSSLGQGILNSGLTIVFVAAGLGLVALGLSRLTQKSPAEHFGTIAGLFGTGKQAAELAALA